MTQSSDTLIGSRRRAAAEALGLSAALFILIPLLGAYGTVIALVAVFTMMVVGGRGPVSIGLRRLPRHWLAMTLAVSVLGYGISALLIGLLSFGDVPAPDLSSFNQLQGDLGAYAFWVAMGWFIGGFAEEMVMRGFLMHRLADAFHGVPGRWHWANLVQAALFGLGHAYQGTGGIILTMGLGVYLGYVVIRTRSLWIAILAHGLINTTTLTLIYLGA